MAQATGPATRSWAALAGAVLVLVGILGFVPNPLLGPSGLLAPTDGLHNIVHIGTGLLALYIAFALRGSAQVAGVMGFGVLYVAIFALVLMSPDLFGLFSVPANVVLHVIHATLAVVSIAVALTARGRFAPSAAA